MNIKEFEKRLDEVLKNNDIMGDIKKECIRLVKSGGVDLEKEQDFGIVKAILKASLMNEAEAIGVPDGYKKTIRNLLSF